MLTKPCKVNGQNAIEYTISWSDGFPGEDDGERSLAHLDKQLGERLIISQTPIISYQENGRWKHKVTVYAEA